MTTVIITQGLDWMREIPSIAGHQVQGGHRAGQHLHGATLAVGAQGAAL